MQKQICWKQEAHLFSQIEIKFSNSTTLEAVDAEESKPSALRKIASCWVRELKNIEHLDLESLP